MNLLSVENISKSFGEKELFKNIYFGIQKGERVALVAKNGSGKTTLLNILNGKEIADEGKVVFRKDLQLAFLSQEPIFDETKSIWNYLLTKENEKNNILNHYKQLIEKQEKNVEEVNANQFHEVLEKMEELQLWDYESRLKLILSKFKLTDVNQKIESLSGGQKKRLALTEVLIQEPELLVLDEPTNHLDIEMIQWLEQYLISNNCTCLIITHDRYFLDQVCTQIMEIDQKKIYTYQGDFEYYLEKKAERLQNEQAEFEKNKNTFRRELEWVRKMPKARGTKSKSRLNAFAVLEEKLKNRRQNENIEISVKMNRLGSKIIELVNVSKGFSDKKLIEHFNYTFKTGEKIGIIGKNGVGKSTLLNMLLGLEQPDQGKVMVGDTVKFGYYNQKGIQLKEDLRVIEVIKEIAEFIPMADGTSLSASSLLTKFNFKPEVQHNFVSKLSGGEKRRLYLLTILVQNPNFLILDEPTNDLDISTLETLEEFLEEFKGCVLVVSHDRYFLDKIADHLFCFEGDGEIKDFPGNFTEYSIWKELNQKSALIQTEKIDKQEKKINEEKKKLSYKEQKELETLEGELEKLENKKKNLELEISNLSKPEELIKASEEISEVISAIDSKTIRWMSLQEKLDQTN